MVSALCELISVSLFGQFIRLRRCRATRSGGIIRFQILPIPYAIGLIHWRSDQVSESFPVELERRR